MDDGSNVVVPIHNLQMPKGLMKNGLLVKLHPFEQYMVQFQDIQKWRIT
jgi:hypothetical protein